LLRRSVGLFLLGFFSSYLIPISIFTALLLGVAGMVFTKRGFKLASASGDREKKDVGFGNFILGGIVILLGLFGCAIACVATS
jgi:hypothetical protein